MNKGRFKFVVGLAPFLFGLFFAQFAHASVVVDHTYSPSNFNATNNEGNLKSSDDTATLSYVGVYLVFDSSIFSPLDTFKISLENSSFSPIDCTTGQVALGSVGAGTHPGLLGGTSAALDSRLVYVPVSGTQCGVSSGSRYGIRIGDSTHTFSPTTGAQMSQDDTGVWFEWRTDSPRIVWITNDITTNTEFLSGNTYIISGHRNINSGITVTVDSGAVLKFDTASSSSLTVNGVLDVEGDDEHFGFPVFITSYKDDLIGGDTNLDATSTSPAAGNWGSISVDVGGSATFTHAIVRYGGAGSSPMIENNGGTLTIASSSIAYSADVGVKNSSGTTTIIATDLGFNTYGLYVAGGTASITAESTIHNNSSYGVYNSTTSTTTAYDNYWGDTSGPTYIGNPGGIGNAISDYVDYQPFIGTTTLHYVEQAFSCPSSSCASVRNRELLLDASTTPYMAELSAATSTWSTLGQVYIALATSTTANLDINTSYRPDLTSKGQWYTNTTQPDSIDLNSYFLDSQTFIQRQNTITHELGHALGLDHSYTGNIMFLAQSSQVTFGPQDIADFNYLWH